MISLYADANGKILFSRPNQPLHSPSWVSSGATSSIALLWKRTFDVMFSALLLAFLAPLFASVTLAQLVSAPRAPVLYRQRRVGRGGEVFSCLKFRSMCTNADVILRELLKRDLQVRDEWAASHKLKDDPRISRVGRILRATSLDELPQLWNVLRGDMSLVGPRPVTEGELQKWYEALGGAEAYKSVRPGITGLWQISGRSGTTYDRRVSLDCRYVRELSAGNDLRILLRTLGAVLRQEGAY